MQQKTNIQRKAFYRLHSKPQVVELLELLHLDKVYHKAAGNYLYYNDGDKEQEVLDFVGGYGSLLLGHNNPELVEYARQLLSDNTPIHAQLSIRSASGELGHRISELLQEKTGSTYVCTFANSGTEAVEAALKHALFQQQEKIDNLKHKHQNAVVNLKNFISRHTFYPLNLKNHNNHVSTKILLQDIANNNDNRLAGKPIVLASEKSFHGKTAASLSVTFNKAFRTPSMQNSFFQTVFFEWDEQKLEKLFRENSYSYDIPEMNDDEEVTIKSFTLNKIAAAIIEPILGEGGVREVPQSILVKLRKLCDEYNVPLIFDEIQAGFYRTGELCSSFESNVFADYYIFGKSLGGGIAKISAVAINSQQYIPKFGVVHTSTFAEDDFSSLLALKTIDIATSNREEIVSKGTYIRAQLTDLQKKHPDVIKNIRGKGLMFGIEFRDYNMSNNKILQMASRSNYLGYFISAYLLNKKNIRVSVTLSDPFTVRIHPGMYVTENSINQLIDALNDLCNILQYMDIYSLIDFMLDEKDRNLRPVLNFYEDDITLPDDSNIKKRVGFLIHNLDMASFKKAEPSLAIIPDDSLEKLIDGFIHLGEPLIIGKSIVTDSKGDQLSIMFAGLPFTSKMIKERMCLSMEAMAKYRNACNKAIDLLKNYGIKTIGLGQFNSIIMGNGKYVADADVLVTSGNSFTVYSSLKAIEKYIAERKENDLKIGIVGAGGNIATIISKCLAQYCGSMVLIGSSQKSEQKIIRHACALLRHVLEQGLDDNQDSVLVNRFRGSDLAQKRFEGSEAEQRDLEGNEDEQRRFLENKELWECYNEEFSADLPIVADWKLSHIADCDIVVLATSHKEAFIEKKHLRKGAFVCDISIPTNCKPEVVNSPDYTVVHGGTITLPAGSSISFKALPLPKGYAYACMSETMLMGFEESKRSYSFGSILASQVEEIGIIGEKHGFNK